MLLDDLTPEMFGELIDECASKKANRLAPKTKGTDPILVRAYVSFHREHWRRRWQPVKKRAKVVQLHARRA